MHEGNPSKRTAVVARGWMLPIPVSAAQRIAADFGYDQVLIMARRVGEAPNPHGEHVTTYGRDAEHCAVAARVGDFLKHKLMGWPEAHPGASFQARVSDWLLECFGARIADDQQERGDRLLEEVLELLQAHGYDRTRVATLTDYVYGRPIGEPDQEAGGVMVTLAAFCRTAKLDMHQAGERELARILQPEVKDAIRRKQESKRGLHTPLPVDPASTQGPPHA
jgi:hypothetical protein